MKLSALTEAPIIPVPQPRANPANLVPRANPLTSAGTTAANFGKRVGLTALSALGLPGARGRLSIQAITNELVKRFIQYVKGRGISDQEITDDILSKYIGDFYGQEALDAVKGTQTSSSQGNTNSGGQGNTGPAPQTNPPGGSPGGVMQNAPNVTNNQTNYQQPNTQPQPPQPAPAAEPPAQPASTRPPAPTPQPRPTPLQRLAASRRKIESQDPWWIMATLSTVLQSAQRGTSRLDEICTTIRTIQRDPEISSRFPQLNLIAVESHDRLFDLMVYLVENQIKAKSDLLRACRQFLPEAFNYTRAELWKIFRVLATHLNQTGQASTTRTDRRNQQRVVGFNKNQQEYGGGIGATAHFGQTQSAGQAQPGATPQQQGAATNQGADATSPNLGATIITPNAVNQAIQQTTSYLTINPQDQNNLARIVGQSGESLDAIINMFGGHVPPNIATLLLFALKSGS